MQKSTLAPTAGGRIPITRSRHIFLRHRAGMMWGPAQQQSSRRPRARALFLYMRQVVYIQASISYSIHPQKLSISTPPNMDIGVRHQQHTLIPLRVARRSFKRKMLIHPTLLLLLMMLRTTRENTDISV